MDNVTKLFKTSAFGFNRSDVVNYIEKTKNDFYDYRIQTEKTINELNDKIKELEEALTSNEGLTSNNKIQDNIDFSSSVSQINEAADHLRETADKICDDIGDFIDKILSSEKEEFSVESEIKDVYETADTIGETAAENLNTEKEDRTDYVSDIDSNKFMSQFSQIIHNAFVEKEETVVVEEANESSSASILDGLLGSSVFSK